MKQGKLLAIVGVLLVFALFFVMRPVREKACPLTKAAVSLSIQEDCIKRGGVVRDGMCTCPE